MEEQVGNLWHRFITRAARCDYPAAAVRYETLAPTLGIVFRALGGDHATALKAGYTRALLSPRNWLQRIAGTHNKHHLCWHDGEQLYLPEKISFFPEAELNRDCYLWLIALAAQCNQAISHWSTDNLYYSQSALAQLPGLRRRYQALVAALFTPDKNDEVGIAEQTCLASLRSPLTGYYEDHLQIDDPFLTALPPIPLWLYPPPAHLKQANPSSEDSDESHNSPGKQPKKRHKRRAQYVDHSKGHDGMLLFRLESLFTWSEFVNVNRTHDDDEDPDAEQAADDLDVLSLARDRTLSSSSALKFDLDLPAPENDDLPLGEGIPLPEWDYKQQRLIEDYCHLQPMLCDRAEPCALPNRLRHTANIVRKQFAMLTPQRYWHKRQLEGDDIDLDAWLEHYSEDPLQRSTEQRVYKSFNRSNRDLATLLLADLSFSTDAWVNNQARVIDIIRDSLFLFAEALSSIRDRFALYGFSSKRNQHIRFNMLKNFNEPYNDLVRGRIDGLRPGYYTRMGAAIRQASKILSQESAQQRLLLLLSDGKPNDLDRYEGRHGIEDTRQAIIAARKEGLHPFCITIDEEADEYLPYLFGSSGYLLIHNPLQLPKQLSYLYMQLTQP